MADTATADTSTTTDKPTTEDAPTDKVDETADWKAEAERWKSQAQKHEKEWKRFSKELDQTRQASMSEQERAVAEARAEGRAEAAKDAASKVAAAEIRAAGSGRLSDSQLTSLLEGVNLAAFVDDDGNVDTDKVAGFVDGIAPAKTADDHGPGDNASAFRDLVPDLGQGGRGAGKAPDDPLLDLVTRFANQ
jgi:hypothetical protein